MTKQRVIEIMDLYTELLRAAGYTPERYEPSPGEDIRTPMQKRRHAMWMCAETRAFAEAGRMEKAFRWLGFVQAVLWCEGIRSIEQMKVDNMPPGELYEAGRV